MKIVKAILVIATAIFMAFHTQIFVSRIEPNPIFSWLASCLIEGFIITLALSKRTPIRYLLLILLFCISVVSASASFLVKNENLLETFFTQKRVIQQLQEDLNRTRESYSYGEKYTTRTLQRERALSDELREILKGQKGDIALVNALIFFMFVLVIQATSVYVATTLKQASVSRTDTPIQTPIQRPIQQSIQTPDTGTDITPIQSPDVETDTDIKGIVRRLRLDGKTYRAIAKETGLSIAKIQRLLK